MGNLNIGQFKGKDRTGQDRTGKDRIDQERTGHIWQ